MILFAFFLFPLMAAGLCILPIKGRFHAWITVAGAVGVFGCALATLEQVLVSSRVTAASGWIGTDALGTLILLLVALVGMSASVFSLGYMDFSRRGGSRRYHIHFNLFLFSLLIVPLIEEPNLVWMAVELTTLFSVLLVAFANTREALEAAWKYVVLTLMGAAVALLGFLLLYWAASRAGVDHCTWTELRQAAPGLSPVLVKAAFGLILLGLGAKVGLVPVHAWLPDAHSQAPTPVCALLSGVETTVVLYVILRLLPIVYAVPTLHVARWLVIFGFISVGVAAFLLLQVRDYKRLFAFSTIEHMGIILVAAGLGGVALDSGALLQIVGHAVTKSFCFYVAGGVLLFSGTQNIAEIRGLIRQKPALGGALFLGGLAIAGAPPFALFLSEFSILGAGFRAGNYWEAGVLLGFIAIAFFGIMTHVSRMVFGRGETTVAPGFVALPLSCRFAIILVVIPVVVLGFYLPGDLRGLIVLAAATMGGGS